MRGAVGLLLLAGLGCAAPALANGRSEADRRYAAYDECIVNAAVRASYTDVRDHEVFDVARAECAAPRARAARHAAAVVEAADAQRAVTLAATIGTLRDRRRTVGAMYGLTDVALR